MSIRTGDEWASPLREMFEACTTPSSANAHLLMGHRGCGKSTELNNLKRGFEEKGYHVCMVDALIETDPFQINQWDIMLLITEGLCKIANDISADIPKAVVNAIINILKKDIEIVEDQYSSVSVDASAGIEAKTPSLLSGVLNLFASLKSNLKLSSETRTTVTEKMQRRASEWLNYTKEISAHITDKCEYKQPIIIFENLDKIPQPEKIFDLLSFSVLSQMPFPVIYTFPIDQFYAPRFASIGAIYTRHILPMIKVYNLDKRVNNDGLLIMGEIVELRADIRLFDEDKDILNMLIRKTGGSLRHLFECIINAARRASWRGAAKIEEEDAERALSELSKGLIRQITKPNYDNLISIIKDPESREQIDDLDFLLKMMQASVVLEYENGVRWNDVHPLVAEFILKHAETKE